MSIVYNGKGARGKKPPISDTSYIRGLDKIGYERNI
jgi:hypothetical protein